MVDRSLDFYNLTRVAPSVDTQNLLQETGKSAFLVEATELSMKIRDMRLVAQRSFSSYIGFHHHMSGGAGAQLLSSSDRVALDQQLALFIATCASSIHDLNVPDSITKTCEEYYKEISSGLLNVRLTLYFPQNHRILFCICGILTIY